MHMQLTNQMRQRLLLIGCICWARDFVPLGQSEKRSKWLTNCAFVRARILLAVLTALIHTARARKANRPLCDVTWTPECSHCTHWEYSLIMVKTHRCFCLPSKQEM